MKIIRNGSNLVVVLNTGAVIQGECTDELFNKVIQANSDEEILKLLPTLSPLTKSCSLIDRVRKSKYLSMHNNSVYWKEVSELSMPEDLVNVILDAEDSNNTDALTAYKNFWILMSLNPDSRCRQNLFWFLNKWGMRISKSGLFVGYRNVDIFECGENNVYSQSLCDFTQVSYEKVKNNKQSPSHYWVEVGSTNNYSLLNDKTKTFDEIKKSGVTLYNLQNLYNEFKAVNFKAKNCGSDTIYTDHHSHTFRIKIGELVTMPRKECDCEQVSCSRGLHLGGTTWLNQNYFGDQGLVCLCNPAKVVSVPYQDDYGKLRTCEYLPIALAEYDNNGKVIPYNVEDGFDSRYIKTVLYSGDVATEELPTYQINIPEIPEVNKSVISEAVYNIAKEFINK